MSCKDFIIGGFYSALGTCGEAKGKRVKGILRIDNRFKKGDLIIENDYHGLVSIDRNTLILLSC